MAEDAPPAWCVRLTAPAGTLPLVELALEQLGGAVVTDHRPAGEAVPVAVYLADAPARARVVALLAQAGLADPEVTIEALPDTDWVAESQRALPAIQVGPFYVHSAHVDTPPPPASLPLLIDANAAFGTGRHESTRGCLLAVADLAESRRFRRPLDMGCGSGILAIAMAKLWGVSVLAVDNDEKAVGVAAENARLNGVAALVEVRHGDSYRCAEVGRGEPFDLIVENILAEAICALAPGVIRHMAPEGIAVFSGLLAGQAAEVLAAHAPLRLKRQWRLGDWVTLVVGR